MRSGSSWRMNPSRHEHKSDGLSGSGYPDPVTVSGTGRRPSRGRRASSDEQLQALGFLGARPKVSALHGSRLTGVEALQVVASDHVGGGEPADDRGNVADDDLVGEDGGDGDFGGHAEGGERP